MRAVSLVLALLCVVAFVSASESFAELDLDLSTEFDASLDAEAMAMHAQYSMDTFQDFLDDTEDLATGATFGKSVDFSQRCPVKTQQCFIKEGYTLSIPRGYRSSGKVDTNLALNVRYGVAAGFKHIHTYLFPCPKCATTGEQQVDELVDYMKKSFIDDKVKMVWLDIEQSKYWLSTTTKNRNFFNSMLKGAAKNNLAVGIYTSKSQWEPIMGRGNSFTAGSKYPLWYAHYDKVPDFKSFSYSRIGGYGGWKKPHMKQYRGDTTLCSFSVDKNIIAPTA
jgi:hypothetical protein